MKKYVLKIALPLLLLSSGPVFAQGTLEDYNRAYSLRQKFSGYQVYHSDVNPHWVTGTSSFWYLQRAPQETSICWWMPTGKAVVRSLSATL